MCLAGAAGAWTALPTPLLTQLTPRHISRSPLLAYVSMHGKVIKGAPCHRLSINQQVGVLLLPSIHARASWSVISSFTLHHAVLVLDVLSTPEFGVFDCSGMLSNGRTGGLGFA